MSSIQDTVRDAANSIVTDMAFRHLSVTASVGLHVTTTLLRNRFAINRSSPCERNSSPSHICQRFHSSIGMRT